MKRRDIPVISSRGSRHKVQICKTVHLYHRLLYPADPGHHIHDVVYDLIFHAQIQIHITQSHIHVQ